MVQHCFLAPRGVFGLLILCLMLSGPDSAILEPVGRLPSLTALVGERNAYALSRFISSGAHFATASGNAISAVSATSLDLARPAWRGVFGLNCTKIVGRVLAEYATNVASRHIAAYGFAPRGRAVYDEIQSAAVSAATLGAVVLVSHCCGTSRPSGPIAAPGATGVVPVGTVAGRPGRGSESRMPRMARPAAPMCQVHPSLGQDIKSGAKYPPELGGAEWGGDLIGNFPILSGVK